MLNHQCPRIRCRIREPAANLLSICLLGCSSRDLQSCGCFSCLYVFGCKITKNPAYSDTFCKLSYGLIAFSLFKGFDILFFYPLKSFLFQIMCYPPCATHTVHSSIISVKFLGNGNLILTSGLMPVSSMLIPLAIRTERVMGI